MITLLHRARAARITVLALGVALAASAASPAFGGPSLGSLTRAVAKATKLAKAADARSRKALAAAQTPGPRGPQGPVGPAGPAGPAGTPGTNATGTTGTSGGVALLDFRANANTTREVYNHAGLVLTAVCSPSGTVQVTAKTTVDHAILHVATAILSPPATTPAVDYVQKNDMLVSSLPVSIVSTGHAQGTLTYSTPTGQVTTATYASEQGAFGGGSVACWFGGTAQTIA